VIGTRDFVLQRGTLDERYTNPLNIQFNICGYVGRREAVQTFSTKQVDILFTGYERTTTHPVIIEASLVFARRCKSETYLPHITFVDYQLCTGILHHILTEPNLRPYCSAEANEPEDCGEWITRFLP
jgi:hypothetical protein